MVGPDTTATTAPPATTTTTTTILQHLRLCCTRAWARTDSAPTDCGPFTNLWPAAAGPPAHGPGQPLRPLPLPARGLAPADPLLKCLGPYRLGAHGGIHFRRSLFCWDPATTSSLPLLYLYPDACRPAVSAAQVPGPVKTRSPRGASLSQKPKVLLGPSDGLVATAPLPLSRRLPPR